jgi:hypothetical protein
VAPVQRKLNVKNIPPIKPRNNNPNFFMSISLLERP